MLYNIGDGAPIRKIGLMIRIGKEHGLAAKCALQVFPGGSRSIMPRQLQCQPFAQPAAAEQVQALA
jgi:hypothetical protein